MVSSEMHNLIERAEQAKTYWLDHSLDKYDFVLLLPHTDNQLNAIMLSAFEAKLQRMDDHNSGIRPKAVVLAAGLHSDGEYFMFRQISEDTAENILILYGMYEFTDKLIIGSFDLPYGRKLRNLLDCGIASGTELAGTVIF